MACGDDQFAVEIEEAYRSSGLPVPDFKFVRKCIREARMRQARDEAIEALHRGGLSVEEYDKAVTTLGLVRREWNPTDRWRTSSRDNLSRSPRRRGPAETREIEFAVRDWLALPPAQRGTQAALARRFGVSRQHINHLIRHAAHPDPAIVPTIRVAPTANPPTTAAVQPAMASPEVSRVCTPSRYTTDALLRWYAKLPTG